jgi:hypothetical protein
MLCGERDEDQDGDLCTSDKDDDELDADEEEEDAVITDMAMLVTVDSSSADGMDGAPRQ